MGIVEVLVLLLILAVVIWVACFAIDNLLPGQPANKIAKAIVAIVALLYLLQRFGLLSGVNL